METQKASQMDCLQPFIAMAQSQVHSSPAQNISLAHLHWMAVQMTSRTLHEYQSMVFRMIRTVIGDHSYMTHRTHQQAFHHFGIPELLVMLSRLATSLQNRLCKRSTFLHPTDLLHSLDWSHLTETMRLVSSSHQDSTQVTTAPDPGQLISTQARHTCRHCLFQTDPLANLRRHLTTCHNEPQLRTFATRYLAKALHGRPQCSHCFRLFTTWHILLHMLNGTAARYLASDPPVLPAWPHWPQRVLALPDCQQVSQSTSFTLPISHFGLSSKVLSKMPNGQTLPMSQTLAST